MPYAYSWWLDVVSPGWESLVLDDYVAVMPLTRNKKLGIDYLFQPFFTQQLGVFLTEVADPSETHRFLAAIPDLYRYIDIQLNSLNNPANSDFFLTVRKNYTLDLTPSYNQLSASYHRNCRRNLLKAINAGLTIKKGPVPSVFTRFIKSNLDKKLSEIGKTFYTVLQQITDASLRNGTGEILGVYNPDGELVAAGWFVTCAGRCIFEVCASNNQGKEMQSMYFLVDHVIRVKAGSELIFDFAGSDIPGVAYFNAGFGTSESTYLAVKRNHLPWPLNIIKK
jgi:hypothetical protein